MKCFFGAVFGGWKVLRISCFQTTLLLSSYQQLCCLFGHPPERPADVPRARRSKRRSDSPGTQVKGWLCEGKDSRLGHAEHTWCVTTYYALLLFLPQQEEIMGKNVRTPLSVRLCRVYWRAFLGSFSVYLIYFVYWGPESRTGTAPDFWNNILETGAGDTQYTGIKGCIFSYIFVCGCVRYRQPCPVLQSE